MMLSKARDILLEGIPDANIQSQPVGDWTGPFALPDALADYYKEVGPVDLEIAAYGNPWYIPSLANLWELQGGYRHHSETHERFEDWSDDWLVVAYEGGDPFIFDIRTATILYDYHGQDVWDPKPMFKNIAEMIAVFGVLGGIVIRAGQELTGEDDCIVPVYYREAQSAIGRILGDHMAAIALLSSLGWEENEMTGQH